MKAVAHERERLEELLADRAVWGLDADQELELEALVAAGHADADMTMAVTAAVLEVSMLVPQDWCDMPPAVRRRIEASGAAWAVFTSGFVHAEVPFTSGPVLTRRFARSAIRYGPWLAAAASVGIAVIAWWPRPATDAVTVAGRDPNRVVAQLASWQDGGPGAAAPMGKVYWSEHCQCGYMKITGLPVNDCDHQYQVWIIDQRGMDQRISGGLFDCKGGEVIVPIHPAIPVRDAQAFAITMEKPGGTWVSDMSNKVAFARCSNP